MFEQVNNDYNNIRELLLKYIDVSKPKVDDVVEEDQDYQVLSKISKNQRIIISFKLH